MLVCINTINYHTLSTLFHYVSDRSGTLIYRSDNIAYRPVISDMYAFYNCDVVVMNPHVYLFMSLQGIFYDAAPLLSSILGWYNPSKTIIIFTLLIANSIHSPSGSTYILSHVYVSTQYLHMYSSNHGVLPYVSIINASPWYLTLIYTVCSINYTIVH